MKEPIEEIMVMRKEQCKEEISSLDLDYLTKNKVSSEEGIKLPIDCICTYAIINRFEGNLTEFSKYCKIYCNKPIKKTRLDIIQYCCGKENGKVSDYGEPRFPISISISYSDLRASIFFFFDNKNSPRVIQHLEWVLEGTDLPSGMTLEELFDTYCYPEDLPRAFAIRGYALMMLGRYKEAIEALDRVLPLTRAGKATGDWMVYQSMYALPYSLIPLCEYLLDPTEQHRVAAWKGREKYMKEITRSDSRFNSYLFYYHLEEAYPEVYIPPVKQKKVSREEGGKKDPAPEVLSEFPDYPESTRDDEPGEGGVVIQDTEDNEWRFVLRVPSFERFISKIQSLSGYPVLSDAITAYTFSTSLDPAAVISECNGLLKEPSLTIEEREAVGDIGKTAMHARDHGACVEFLFNEYW